MALLGYQFPGAMAEYVAIPFASPGRNVFRLPDELSFEDGASAEPLSISFFSIKRGQPAEKDTAAVLGAGVIGLNAIQVLKSMGVQRVLATGRRPIRLEAAKGCGADVVVDAAKEDVLSAIMGATSGMGVDITVEYAGTQETFDQSIEMTRGGGKVILVGVYEQPLAWDPLKAMTKNLTLIGCLGEISRPPSSFSGAAKSVPALSSPTGFPWTGLPRPSRFSSGAWMPSRS
jgi:threonine dehydrogenase-like Zn-dependent dehydrogenase